MAMVVQPGEPPPAAFTRSVFLANASGHWEAEAVGLLAAQVEFVDAVVFVGSADESEAGCAWRKQALSMSDLAVFWAPSAGPLLSAAASAVCDFAAWAATGKLIAGGALSGPLAQVAADHAVPLCGSVAECVAAVCKATAAGASRQGAERLVPLMIWRTPSFGSWYGNLLAVGNRLDGAVVEWSFRVGPRKTHLLFWSLLVDIHVTAEGRNKSNEVVISRPDIACVLAYAGSGGRACMLDTAVILIREFRSPGRSADGFVHELPGGSTFKPNSDFYQTASDELFEETGVRVAKDRLRLEASRQAAATLSTHHVNLMSVELTPEEMAFARHASETNAAFGNMADESEQTFIEVTTIRAMLAGGLVDFGTLGMIMQAVGPMYDIEPPTATTGGGGGAA